MKAEVAGDNPLWVRIDRFELDEANASLTCDGRAVPLQPRPFELLCALVRTPGVLITKNALLDRVWGHRFVSDAVLRTAMSDLRSALGDDPRRSRFIETVSRRGYRFIGAVTHHRNGPQPPSGHAAKAASSLVGRTDALERLRSAWQLAGKGTRQVVWIAGEAGAGKTTLIDRFTSEVGESFSAHGQCLDQHGAREPYLPILEAMTGLCRRDPTVAALLHAVAPSWLPQLPWLAAGVDGEAVREKPAAGPDCVLREMGELLDRCTDQRPLLLVTEDLHWSDPATVQLIDYIARRRAPTRLMWIASFRLTEIIATEHPLKSLRQELGLHGLTKEIVLDPFSEEDVAEYLRPRRPLLAADDDFVRALHRRTDGLPLFVADLVDDLLRPEAAGDANGAAAHHRLAFAGVPEGLTGIVERYVAELTDEHRSLLEVASLCGCEFALSTVAGALNRDPADLAAAWAELVYGRRWLREVGPRPPSDSIEPLYAFRHALYREVLQKRLGCVNRLELQRRISRSPAVQRDAENAGDASLARLPRNSSPATTSLSRFSQGTAMQAHAV